MLSMWGIVYPGFYMSHSEVLVFIDEVFIGKFSVVELNQLITEGRIVEGLGYTFKVPNSQRAYGLNDVKNALAKLRANDLQKRNNKVEKDVPLSMEFEKETAKYFRYKVNSSSSRLSGNVYISKESVEAFPEINLLLEDEVNYALMKTNSLLGSSYIERFKKTKNYDVYRLTPCLGLSESDYKVLKEQDRTLPFLGNIYMPTSSSNKDSMKVHLLRA